MGKRELIPDTKAEKEHFQRMKAARNVRKVKKQFPKYAKQIDEKADRMERESYKRLERYHD